MGTVRWLGKSVAVAQVSDGEVTTYDAATTYSIVIGGVRVSVIEEGAASSTATALRIAAAASTHPYFSNLTWTSPSALAVTATAGAAGVPFTAAITAEGGTGTVDDFSNTIPSSGPQHWDDADNWDTGVLPTTGDDVILENSSSTILYGLDQITDALGSISVLQNFTGRIGLNSFRFSTGGTTSSGEASEYREDYLKIDVATIEIGQQIGPGTPIGSGRVKINNTKAAASTCTVFGTASAGIDVFQPAVRYLAAHASADVTVIAAPGGVGIGMEYDGETATVGAVEIRTTNNTDQIFIGSGVTWSTYKQFNGVGQIDAAADVTSVDIEGGNLNIIGDFTITTVNNDGGEVVDDHIKTAGNAITVLNNNSGTYNLSVSSNARTIATLNQGRNATTLIDPDAVTVTTFNNPSDRYQMETESV